MRSKFLEACNAVNLIRNGGLDFAGSGLPPFWALEGASFAEQTPNNCTVIKNETPISVNAAVNYFKLFLSSPASSTLRYLAAYRFIQMGFCSGVTVATDGKFNYSTIDAARVPVGYDKMRICQLLRGEMAFSWSMRVVSGMVKVSLCSREIGSRGIPVVVYSAAASRDWVRPVVNVDVERGALESVDFIIEKIGGEAAEVHLGAFMGAAGSYDVLPYTGDPMADAIPKGAVVFAVGNFCPPGFERVTLTNVPSKGRAFLKATAPADLAVEGSETHKHTTMVEKMAPETDWPGLGVEDGWGVNMDESGTAKQYPADLAWDAHTHPTDSATSLPSSRDVVLCKRL